MAIKLKNSKIGRRIIRIFLFLFLFGLTMTNIYQESITNDTNWKNVEKLVRHYRLCKNIEWSLTGLLFLVVIVLLVVTKGSVEKYKIMADLFGTLLFILGFGLYQLHLFFYPIWYEQNIMLIVIREAFIDAAFISIIILLFIQLIKSIPARIMYVARQKAERENREQRYAIEQMRQELLTNISHDLRTPLTSIISYIEILKNEELGEPAAEYVRRLDKKASALRRMVDDVVYLSKLTSQNVDVKIEKINVKRLLEQALCEWEEGTRNSSQDIKVTYVGKEMWLETDGSKLYRVLQNLYENARKYAKQGTSIEIEYKCVDEKNVSIQMKNESSYPMHFDGKDMTGRFTRADQTRTSSGHGLGLAIAEELMQICGGKLTVDVQDVYFIVTLFFG